MKILVVDDSIFMQKTLTRIIENHFSQVTLFTGSNGLQGLKVYESEKPDIIIVDLLMPVMTGLEMIETVRKSDNKVKIIVLTADVQKSVFNEIEPLSVEALINKPLNDEKIEKLINIIGGSNDA